MFKKVRQAASVEYDTDSEWSSKNKLIPLGVITYATDTHVIKIGDGVSRYTDLPVRVNKVLTSSEKAMLESVNLAGGVVRLTDGGVIDTSLYMDAVSSSIASALQAHDSAELAHPFLRNLFQEHIDRIDNPHSVTKDQLGLGNVSNFTQIPLHQKNAADGVAPLDSSKNVPATNLPMQHSSTEADETKVASGKAVGDFRTWAENRIAELTALVETAQQAADAAQTTADEALANASTAQNTASDGLQRANRAYDRNIISAEMPTNPQEGDLIFIPE